MPDEEVMPNAGEAAHVTVKAPEFIDTNPSAYFSILEAQFMLKNVSQSTTKFYNVISSLPPDVVGRLPPEVLDSASYDMLKETVISTYEKTKPEILSKLMRNHSISGRPSIYLNEMLTLASKIQLGDQVVRHQFIQALPPTISPIIASQKNLSLKQLGELADDLLPFMNNQQVNVVNTQQQHHRQSRAHSPFNNRPSRNFVDRATNDIPIGIRPYSANQRPVICRSHLYFGPKAKNCKQWCRWPQKQGLSMLPNSRSSSPAPSNSTLN